jgi:hypothetical protein
LPGKENYFKTDFARFPLRHIFRYLLNPLKEDINGRCQKSFYLINHKNISISNIKLTVADHRINPERSLFLCYLEFTYNIQLCGIRFNNSNMTGSFFKQAIVCRTDLNLLYALPLQHISLTLLSSHCFKQVDQFETIFRKEEWIL